MYELSNKQVPPKKHGYVKHGLTNVWHKLPVHVVGHIQVNVLDDWLEHVPLFKHGDGEHRLTGCRHWEPVNKGGHKQVTVAPEYRHVPLLKQVEFVHGGKIFSQ